MSIKAELDPKVSDKTERVVNDHLDIVGGRCHFRMKWFCIHWKYCNYTELEKVSFRKVNLNSRRIERCFSFLRTPS